MLANQSGATLANPIKDDIRLEFGPGRRRRKEKSHELVIHTIVVSAGRGRRLWRARRRGRGEWTRFFPHPCARGGALRKYIYHIRGMICARAPRSMVVHV